MFVTLLVAVLIVWAFAWLYLATAWNPQARLKHVKVSILSCDVGVPASVQQQLPAALRPLAAQLNAQPLGVALLSRSAWNVSSPAHRVFNWRNFTCPGHTTPTSNCTPEVEAACLKALQQQLLDGEVYAAVHFPSNLSTSYITTAFGTNTSAQLKPLLFHYIKATGRQMSSFNLIDAGIRSIHRSMSDAFTGLVASTPQLANATNPFFYIAGLTLRTTDLAPVLFFGQNLATYLLQMMVWIAALAVVATLYDFRLPAELAHLTGGPKATVREELTTLSIRASVGVVTTLVCSALLIAVVVALGDGKQFVGENPGYAIAFLWFCSWTYMAVNGVLINVLGPTKYSIVSTLLLVLQITSSTGVLGHELSPAFYKVGWVFPFFWGVRGLRAIFFGALTHHLWKSWLVMLFWNLGSGLVWAVVWVARTRGHLHPLDGIRGQPERDVADVGQVHVITPIT